MSKALLQMQGLEFKSPQPTLNQAWLLAHICNPGTPVVRWEAETQESLKSSGVSSQLHTVGRQNRRNPASNHVKGEEG